MQLSDRRACRSAAQQLQVRSEREVITRNEVVRENKPLGCLLKLIAFPGGLALLCAAAIITVKADRGGPWFIVVMVVGCILWMMMWMLPILAVHRSNPPVKKRMKLLSVRAAKALTPPSHDPLAGTIVATDDGADEAVALQAIELRRYGEVTFRCGTSNGFSVRTDAGEVHVPAGDIHVEIPDDHAADLVPTAPEWLKELAPEALESRGLCPFDEERRLSLRQGDRVLLRARLMNVVVDHSGYREAPDTVPTVEGVAWLRSTD